MAKILVLFMFIGAVFATGGWRRVSKNLEQVKSSAQFATKRISSGTNSAFHQKLVEIVKVERQVVAGPKYRITMNVKDTVCRKSQHSFEEAQNCDLLDASVLQTCVAVVWVKPWENFREVLDFSCSVAPRKPKTEAQDDDMGELYRKLYVEFIRKYKKSYDTEYEKEKRFKIFKLNLKKIKELNENEQGTAIYGITKFTDLNENEYRKYNLGLRPDLANPNDVLVEAEIPNVDIPKSFDWRTKNAVTEVKNQGQCGSCWAFSTTGNIEGQWAINKKKLISLSEQELVDCDKVDSGCEGGLPSNAYKEIIRLGGLETEKEYPYEGEDDNCSFKKKEVEVYINNSVSISKNETEMAAWLVKNGPISIGINANAMQFYFGGISHPLKFLCSPDNLDHGVLIVGYGVHTYPLFKVTLPFWIIKNSWGASWGEQGYYRVYRGDGTCGLNLMATSSVIS